MQLPFARSFLVCDSGASVAIYIAKHIPSTALSLPLVSLEQEMPRDLNPHRQINFLMPASMWPIIL